MTGVASLVLVRRAESTWNVERRMQGHANPPHTERGRAQAAALSAGMAKGAIDAVISSDLERTMETASVIARGLSLTVHVRRA